MTDEFLHALRRQPPAQFARDLKRKLQLQDAEAKRRSWSLRTRTIVFLIVGSAFAGGMLVFQRQAAEQAESAQSRADVAAEGKATASAYRPRPLNPTFVPEGNGTNPRAFDDSEQTDAASTNSGLSTQSASPSENRTGAASTAPEQAMGGGLLRSRPPAKIATSPLNDALVRNVLDTLRSRKPNADLQIERMDPDAAFAALCARENAREFDLVVTSRRISYVEFDTCRRNGVARITESKLGYQAVVLTSVRDSVPMKLSPSDVYLGLAKQVPDWVEPTRFVPNPNVTWDQIDKLAYRPIMVFGPASKTPLRSLFEALVLDPGCKAHRALKALEATDPERYAELCYSLRGGRWYSDVEQNGLLIPQYLWTDPNPFAIVDYEFYLDNRAQLAGSALTGPEPSDETFANGTYPFARPVYVYADETRLGRAVGTYEAMRELELLRRYGQSRFGLSPLGAQEREELRHRRTSIISESDLIPKRSDPR